MTLDEFREICASHHESEPGKQESLARLLHQLGVVLHFVDEPRLRDTAVLDPHWVTDGVYRLLRFNDRPGSDGVLTTADAIRALDGEPEQNARFLLRLMERFEMCFPLEEEGSASAPDRWLIPGALDQFQPEGISDEWQGAGGVRLRYVYDPLPEGVIPRFVVRTHLLSEGQPRWRHGVVLDDGRARAMIRRNRDRVEVTALGPDNDRLRMLEIVQGNLERIHADLPDPKPYAELELEGLPGVYRPVADLEAAELGRQQVAVPSGGESVLVEPTRQLNRTSEAAARRDERVPLQAFLSYSHKDKRAKATFQDNLMVLQQKKFIAPWHDGLIEPGMRWKEEIEESLAQMDVFVGLLTTSFLASDFIQTVELREARKRLAEADQDFLFVLILVDDISLDGLDLGEYQILKPGGRSVSQHPSRRQGFDEAQKELEALIRSRQARMRASSEEAQPSEPRSRDRKREAAGVTAPPEADRVAARAARETWSDDSPVAQALASCAHMIGEDEPGERRDSLELIRERVERLLGTLTPEEQAERAAVCLEMLVSRATRPRPSRRWYDKAAEGLLEAAEHDITIADPIERVGQMLWPDYELPEPE